MKKGWDRYASDKGIIKKGYIKKHRNGSESGQTSKASRSDSVLSSAEGEEEEITIDSKELGRKVIDVLLNNYGTCTFKKDPELSSENIPIPEYVKVVDDGILSPDWEVRLLPTSSTSPDCPECTPDTKDLPKRRSSGSRPRAKKSRKGNTSPLWVV